MDFLCHDLGSGYFIVQRSVHFCGKMYGFVAGLRVAREQCFNLNSGNRRNTPDIALLITDGYATSDVRNTIPEAELLKGAGAHIMTVRALSSQTT